MIPIETMPKMQFLDVRSLSVSPQDAVHQYTLWLLVVHQPEWKECKFPKSLRRTYSFAGTQAVRRLLTAWARANTEDREVDKEEVSAILDDVWREDSDQVNGKTKEGAGKGPQQNR